MCVPNTSKSFIFLEKQTLIMLLHLNGIYKFKEEISSKFINFSMNLCSAIIYDLENKRFKTCEIQIVYEHIFRQLFDNVLLECINMYGEWL